MRVSLSMPKRTMKRKQLTDFLVNLSRAHKQLIAAIFDTLLVIFSAFMALELGSESFHFLQLSEWLLVLSVPLVAIPTFIHLGVYNEVMRHFSFAGILALLKAIFMYATIWSLCVLILRVELVTVKLLILNCLVSMGTVISARIFVRWGLNYSFGTASERLHPNKRKVVILGTGSNSIHLSASMKSSQDMQVVAFVDHKGQLQGNTIQSYPVWSLQNLETNCLHYNISKILIATDELSRQNRDYVLKIIEKHAIQILEVPPLEQVVTGQIKLSDFHELSIEDLLGREVVPPNQQRIQDDIQGKIVMVTGGGGSIGSELVRLILECQPAKLVIFEMNEFNLYKIIGEVSQLTASDSNVEPVTIIPALGDVKSYDRLKQICSQFAVEKIYHAAAYKHVPMVENNVSEGIYNNSIGTLNCVKVAIECKLDSFVLISTDKAVRPTNVMGASKRIAEMIVQAQASVKDCPVRFMIVRFGNVLNSSGSVIPLFKEQIANGGPITVTHPEINRYFMTIKEASQLVLQACALGSNGDVFVLDMGSPVNITNLAKRMIHLSGLEIKNEDNPDGDIEITYTGLRPGEKLYEELLVSANNLKTEHPKIMREREVLLDWPELEQRVNQLLKYLRQQNFTAAREQIGVIVPEYVSEKNLKTVTQT